MRTRTGNGARASSFTQAHAAIPSLAQAGNLQPLWKPDQPAAAPARLAGVFFFLVVVIVVVVVVVSMCVSDV